MFFSNVPEGQICKYGQRLTGDVTLTVTGVATLGSSAGSVAIFSSIDNQYTGVQVYQGVLAEVEHLLVFLGSFTSGFSGGATQNTATLFSTQPFSGAVFGLGETTGNDYQQTTNPMLSLVRSNFYGFTTLNSLYSINISQQVSLVILQDRWFLHSIR